MKAFAKSKDISWLHEVNSAYLGAVSGVMYSVVQIKWNDLLHPITWLFLDRFLTFLHESHGTLEMPAFDTKHIKIGQFV